MCIKTHERARSIDHLLHETLHVKDEPFQKEEIMMNGPKKKKNIMVLYYITVINLIFSWNLVFIMIFCTFIPSIETRY